MGVFADESVLFVVIVGNVPAVGHSDISHYEWTRLMKDVQRALYNAQINAITHSLPGDVDLTFILTGSIRQPQVPVIKDLLTRVRATYGPSVRVGMSFLESYEDL